MWMVSLRYCDDILVNYCEKQRIHYQWQQLLTLKSIVFRNKFEELCSPYNGIDWWIDSNTKNIAGKNMNNYLSFENICHMLIFI